MGRRAGCHDAGLKDSGIDLSGLQAISGSGAAARQRLPGAWCRRRPRAPRSRTTAGRPAPWPVLARGARPSGWTPAPPRTAGPSSAAVGGDAALARLTGSRAFERFTGPQIRKFARTDPDGYARTERIHLVSSFLASLLAGGHAPIEPGDGSGMNLMDIGEAVGAGGAASDGPDLAGRLPPIRAPSGGGRHARALLDARYGLPPAKVIAWSGDNPCSLVGVGLLREGASPSRSARATRSSASCPRPAWTRPERGTCSARRPATTWASSASRTARWPASVSGRHSGSTGRDSPGAAARNPRRNGGASCCRGSKPEITPSVLAPASAATASTTPTARPTCAPSSRRR